MNLIRVNGELKIDGVNERMKRTLGTPQGREKLAEFIVRGNGRAYTRDQIKQRIQKVCRRIVGKLVEV
jgi:hypothetical protein